MTKYKLIDLFAGAGGLSLGFKKTNRFEIALAVEINKHMRETYQANHPGVKLETDIKNLDYSILKKDHGNIDLVIGGPPCQGFSNANRQKNSLICGNNQLVKEYIKAIEHLKPKAFVMENVKTMASDKHKFFYTINDNENLKGLDIKISRSKILIGNSNPITNTIAKQYNADLEHSLEKYKLDDSVFVKLNSIFKSIKKNNYILTSKKHLKTMKSLNKDWNSSHQKLWNNDYEKAWHSLQHLINNETFNIEFYNVLKLIIDSQVIIRKLVEIETSNVELENVIIEDNSIAILVKTYNVFEYVKSKLKSLGYIIHDNIFNAANFGVPQVRERLMIIGIRNDIINKEPLNIPDSIEPYNNENNYNTIKDAIFDLEELKPFIELNETPLKHTYDKVFKENDLIKFIRNEKCEIYNHITTNSRNIALKRFAQLKPGQNFHDLNENLKTTYSDPSRTQNTIYKRLEYNKPSSTVVNVRKSMWIHPTQNRAISIREAARLQSFPDDFIFKGPKDAQYQQIGNAVPPLLARAIAKVILDYLDNLK